jgi:hypothetical protein
MNNEQEQERPTQMRMPMTNFTNVNRQAHSAATRMQAERAYDALWQGVDINEAGYVYMIRYDGESAVKIGCCTNMKSRMGSFNTAHKTNVDIIYARWVEDCEYVELQLHNEFRARQIRREWFALTEDDIDHAIMILQAYEGEDYTA